MTWKPKHPGRLAGATGAMLCMQLAGAQGVDELLEAGEERILQAQAQQQQIEAVAEDTQEMFQDYLQAQREIEDLLVYNDLLRALVEDQRVELEILYRNIDEVGTIEGQILPLMARMIDGLERFIDLDVPFLQEERYAQVERLRALMTRSDVTTASQFNNVLTQWMVEMEDYGMTIDVYTDEIVTADGVTREVQLLRIGRIALLYITPDGSHVGAWDKNARAWVPLDESMVREIRIGIESYESEQAALFVAPVSPPEER